MLKDMDRKNIFNKLLEEGLTVTDIGKKYNISHQRVCQILKSQVKKFHKYKIKQKSYLDYLKESDYSKSLKNIYIKNYKENVNLITKETC